MNKILIFLFLVFLGIAGYFGYQWYFTNDNFMRQIYLVPSNAVYILQTEDPVKNWGKFSESKLWQHFKQHPKFAALAEDADDIDKFFKDNKNLLGSIGSRQFTLSAHVTKYNDYDYLFIIDLSRASKIGVLKNSVEGLFSNLGFKVTVRTYKAETIYEMFDPEDHSTLFLSLVANQAVCSYYGALVEKAIDEKDQPIIAKENKFMEVEEKTGEGNLARFFINYKYANEFLRCYLTDLNGWISDISSTLEFTGVGLSLIDEDIEINGITNLKDSTDGYLKALLRSGKGNIGAYEVLPLRTASYTSLGCSNFSDFYDNLLKVLGENPKELSEFNASVSKIEKLLKINLKTNFYSWMGDEVVLSQNQSSGLSAKPEYILTIHATEISDAVKNLDFVEDQVRKRTPAKMQKTTYKDHDIHYLEVKGLFTVLLGKFFNKIDKPYYTVIDDYVCFSNNPETIIALIDDYDTKQTLGNNESFKTFIRGCNSSASVFCYVNGQRYFNSMLQDLKGESRRVAMENKKYITCFRHSAFELIANGAYFNTFFLSDFETGDAAQQDVLDMVPASLIDKDSLSDRERFYVEQFKNGTLQEDHENGKPKLRVEESNGLKDGKYREYYEDGSIKVKGFYSKGKKDGKWRYYDTSGKLIKKEHYDDGELKE
jgi:hypothetical protein